MISTLGFNRKGNAVLDTAIIIIFLFVFVFVIYIISMINNAVNDEVQLDEDFNTDAKDMSLTFTNSFDSTFDGIVLGALILLWIAGLISAFMIDSHPIFLVISVILMVFVFLFAAMMGNMYEDFSLDPDISDVALRFPQAHWIMTHILQIIVVIAFTIGMVLYGKRQNS